MSIFVLFFLFFVFLGSIVWIWALIDCVKNEPNDGNEKLFWILIILFTHFIGAILYFIIQKPKRNMDY